MFGQVYWQFTGVTSQAEQRVTVHDDLDLQFVVPKDSGNYTCHNDADDSVVVSYTILVPGEHCSNQLIFTTLVLIKADYKFIKNILLRLVIQFITYASKN